MWSLGTLPSMLSARKLKKIRNENNNKNSTLIGEIRQIYFYLQIFSGNPLISKSLFIEHRLLLQWIERKICMKDL
jgi:hypothetical protein